MRLLRPEIRDVLSAAIAEAHGPRCGCQDLQDGPDGECAACDAWSAFDTLFPEERGDMSESEIPKKSQKAAVEALEYYAKPQNYLGNHRAKMALAEILAEQKRIKVAEKPFEVRVECVEHPHHLLPLLHRKVHDSLSLGRFATRTDADNCFYAMRASHPQSEKLRRQAAADCVDEWMRSRAWGHDMSWHRICELMLKPAKCVCGCERSAHCRDSAMCVGNNCPCTEYRPEPEAIPTGGPTP